MKYGIIVYMIYMIYLIIHNGCFHYPKKVYIHRAKIWLTKHNHHYLRITRILKSLIELGLSNESMAFYKCLTDTIYPYYSIYIGLKTLSIWKKAFLTHTLIKKKHNQ